MIKIRIATLGALVLFVGGTGVLAVFWGTLPLWEQEQIAKARCWTVELQEQRQEVMRRIELRSRIVMDVIDERLSLLEAAAHFRDLNQSAPASFRYNFQQCYPECSTDDERHCMQVIEHVEAQLSHDPRQSEVVARLRREMQGHREMGTLRLPD